MPTVEQKMTLPHEPTLEKKEKKDYAKVQGFEARALELKKTMEENEERAKKKPQEAVEKQKDIEMHVAGFWLNVRLAQASRVRLGDTPQEIGKNAKQLDAIAENLGRQPVDAYVYYLEKMLPEFTHTAGSIEKAWLDKNITADEAVEQRMDLSARLSDFIERKVFLVEQMVKGEKEGKEKDTCMARIQAVQEKALRMCRAADAPLEKMSEKTEKK